MTEEKTKEKSKSKSEKPSLSTSEFHKSDLYHDTYEKWQYETLKPRFEKKEKPKEEEPKKEKKKEYKFGEESND